LLLLSACQVPPKALAAHAAQTMGTQYSVEWPARATIDDKKLGVEFDRRLEQINQAMSTYIVDSEISRFNRLPPGSQMGLSEDFAVVMLQAIKIARQTQGAFDFTVGPLVNLWGFGPPGARTTAPKEADIAALMSGVGYENIQLQADENKLSKPGISTYRLSKHRQSEIDLSAIAKGYAVDALARLLEENGIENYLVEIGGEVRARGRKPDGSAWRIGIEIPQDRGRAIEQVLALHDISVATSGDYRNYFEQDGVRYSHTIDPATGYPIRRGLASVTVLANDCARADALATALMVMGPDKGMKFAGQQGIAAHFIIRAGAGFSTRSSQAFDQYLR